MNVLVSSLDPRECSYVLDDETLTGSLSEAMHILGLAAYYHTSEHLYPIDISEKYRDHICVRWARRDRKHYKWLLLYARSLCSEYEARTGMAHHWESNLRGLRRAGFEFPEIALVSRPLDGMDSVNDVAYNRGLAFLVGSLGSGIFARPWYWPNLSGSKAPSDQASSTYTLSLLGIKIWPDYTLLPCGLYQKKLTLFWQSRPRWRLAGEWISAAEIIHRARKQWEYGYVDRPS